MDRWLGDGGMPVIAAIGGNITEYGEGWAAAEWVPTEMACNPSDGVQAGVYAVMLDAAMNFAINASLDGKDRTKGTLEMKTDCLKGASKGDTLKVRGQVSRMTKLIAFTEATVHNEKGELICRSTGTFMIHRGDP
ncbi:MAG TPA: PaaI family thioesterase [Acidimicrobiales bacterium]|nr:PaaI family thioesterase [Acidimicrobiales bacterium]